MTNIDDITELIRRQLVLSEPDREQANRNLVVLVRQVEQLMTAGPDTDVVQWSICDDCGASVTDELIHPDGAGWDDDGNFQCSDCR
jgi:hypothetical protein